MAELNLMLSVKEGNQKFCLFKSADRYHLSVCTDSGTIVPNQNLWDELGTAHWAFLTHPGLLCLLFREGLNVFD